MDEITFLHIKEQLDIATQRSLIFSYAVNRGLASVEIAIFFRGTPNVNVQLEQLNTLFTTKYHCTTELFQDQLALCVKLP